MKFFCANRQYAFLLPLIFCGGVMGIPTALGAYSGLLTPSEVSNTGVTLDEGATAYITGDHLEFVGEEEDVDPKDIEYTLTSIPAHGILFKGGRQLEISDDFTQKDLEEDKISYQHDGSESTSDSFAFEVNDDEGETESGVFQITISLLNENSPAITPAQVFSVDENAENNTSVGTATATDEDSETTYTAWAISTGNAGDVFGINSETGEITVNDNSNLDYEATTSYSLSITVSDGTNTSAAETVEISVSDLNDNAPLITPSQSFNVNEDADNASVVGTALVTDADAGTTFSNWTITSGNEAGIFTIGSGTGQLTVIDNSNLDATTYALALTVSDGANTSAPETVEVEVNDVNDNIPVVTSGQSFPVDENTANTTVIGTVQATDIDSETTFQNWAITSGNEAGVFSLGSSTGEITVANNTSLDFETTTAYGLVVTVSDGENTSEAETVEITVNDLNDNAPVIAPDQEFAINEDAASATPVGTAQATDADSGTALSGWLITSGNDAGIFTVNSTSGLITILDNTSLEATTYALTLTVTDGVNTSSPQSLGVTVNDVNDNPPVITSAQSFNVAEDAENSTLVGTVQATDADAETTLSSWAITSGNDDGIFAINASSGEITVTNNFNLDYEATDSYTLTITVSDGENTSDPGSVAIIVDDANDNTPVIAPAQEFNVDENATNETVIGTVAAEDADGGSTLSGWAITAGNSAGLFAVSSETGEITVHDNSGLDFESKQSHSLTLVVSDGSNTSSEEAVTINVNDLNDNAPVIGGEQVFGVSEDVDNGTVVGTVSVSDADASSSFSEWTIAAGNNDDIFSIGSITGEITVSDNSNLDYDETESYTLTLTVSDGVNTSSPTNVTINVGDFVAKLTIADVSVNESEGTATISISMDESVFGGFTVDVNTVTGTATPDDDYISLDGESVRFLGFSGETQDFTVSLVDDDKVEADETFTISLSNVDGYFVSANDVDVTDKATVTIVNDDVATVIMADVNSGEDDGDATVTLVLDNAVDGGFAVDVRTVNGTAKTSDSDYNAVVGETITFEGAAGEEKSFTISFIEDSKVEADEVITVKMGNLASTSLDVDISDEALVTITNDDAAKVVIGDVSGREDAGSIALSARLDNAVDGGFSLTVSTSDGSAEAGTDYSPLSGQKLTFSGTKGEVQDFSITPIDDSNIESGETLMVNMDSLKVAIVSSVAVDISQEAIVTINDDDTDDFVTIGMTDVANPEGNSGTVNLAFTVTLDAASTSAITVDYATSDGSALAGSDYTSVSGTLTFAPGETSKQISVALTPDQVVEADETFTVSLSNNTGESSIGTASAIGTIENDDSASVSMEDISGSEGNGSLTVIATLDKSVDGGFTVEVGTVDGTATAGSDYESLSAQVLTFEGSAGEQQSFSINIIDDAESEQSETFSVVMNNLDASIASEGDIDITDDATVTIHGDDAGDGVQISVEDAAISEGNSGSSNLVFTVSLDQSSTTDVVVNYSTSDGTALAGSDYTTASGTLTFAPGETNKRIEVPVSGDQVVENNEVFSFGLDSNTGESSIARATATGTITNDDQASVLIEDVSGAEGAGEFTFTATLDKAVDGGFTLGIEASDGTATGGTDYTSLTEEPLVFSGEAGEARSFAIALIDDEELEPNETITIAMQNLVASNVAEESIDISDQAVATIIDDDRAQVIVSDASISEDDGSVTVNLTLNRTVLGGFTLEANTSDSTAIAGQDYESVSAQGFFFIGYAGEQKTMTLLPLADNLDEDDEIFMISLTNYSGFNRNVDISHRGKVTIIDDDHTPAIAASQIFEVNELAGNGSPVGTISADDEDDGTTLTNWTIHSGNEEGAFSLDVNTGVISVTDSTILDYGSTAQYILSVSVSDGLNVSNTAEISINVIDNLAPSVTLSAEAGEVTDEQNVTITATFDEQVSGLDLPDIEVTNGTVSTLSTEDALVFTFTVSAVSDGTVNISIPAGAAQDDAGNGNQASNEVSYFYDGGEPVATLSLGSLSEAEPPGATVFVDFSEAVTGLTESDFQLSTGSIGSLTGSMNAYTLEIVDVTAGQCTVTLLAGAVTDEAGNVNDAASLDINFDSTGPSDFVPSFIDRVVTTLNQEKIAFQIAQTEEGADYTYQISSKVSDQNLEGSGVSPGGVVLEEGLDLSEFPDGGIVLSVTMTDEFGNIGLTKTDEIIKSTTVGIPQGISPDGDGANDTWVIPGIAQFPNNHVSLFNRWGNLVYEVDGYDNETKVFTGLSNNSFKLGGEMPDGTYYYVIELDPQTVRKGYLIINK